MSTLDAQFGYYFLLKFLFNILLNNSPLALKTMSLVTRYSFAMQQFKVQAVRRVRLLCP
jgi:hypothetical protein